MSEKEKLFSQLLEKSGKKKAELEKLIADKINELSGLVSEEGAMYIIANELGLRLESEKPKRELNLLKIQDIKEPKVPVSLVCKIIKIYDKVTFSSESGSQGSVQSILVGDETGITRVVFWNDKTQVLANLHEGDVLRISNAYTRQNANNERIEVHFGQYSDLEVNPKGIKIEVKPMERAEVNYTLKKINDLADTDRNIRITGLVTDFDIPRYYFACPECFKKVLQDEGVQKCTEHGEITAVKVPIVNIVLDDGSGSIKIIAFRERAEKMTGLPSEEIISLTENVNKYKLFVKKIIGSNADLVGNISVSSYSGEKQFLINQILNFEIKNLGEVISNLGEEKEVEDVIAEEIISEAATTETKKKGKSEKSESKNKKKVVEEETAKTESSDDDLEIEEIDLDEDLL